MKRANLIIAFFSIALGQLAAKELTLRDYQILGAVVATDAPHGPVYVWHLIEPLSAIDPGGIKSALSFFPEARPTAKAWEAQAVELDIDRLNAVVDSIPSIFRKPQSIKLLDQAPLQNAAGQISTSIWFMSPVLIPGADSVIRLSRPVVREDGRVAFVICAHCAKWSGSVFQHEVDKDSISGRWRLGRTSSRTFTHWENGNVFEYRTPDVPKSSSDCH